MPIVTGVKFRGTGKQYYFAPRDIRHLNEGDRVIVETARGRELGEVVSAPHEVDDRKVVGRLKPVVRKAGPADLLAAERYQLQEEEASVACQEQVDAAGLKMKIVRGEYNFDGSRLTFYFTSEKRVDFRSLVRDLARVFKTRIELRQIGVRDEAKMISGVGKCGRPLCCSTWLQEFKPVSIKMAKNQDLPLSPMEISGLCGRLLCCLTYEDEMYRTVKKDFPRRGKMVDTPLGPARVRKINVFEELAVLRLEDGEQVEMTAAQIAGDEPFVREEETDASGRGLDQALQANRRRRPSGRSSQGGGSGNEQSRSNSRSRRRRKSSSRRSSGQGQSGQQESSGKQTGQSAQSQSGGQSGTSQQGGGSGSSSSKSRSKRRRRRRRPSGNRGGQSTSGQGGQQSGGNRQSSGQHDKSSSGQSGSGGQAQSKGRSSSSRRRSRSNSRPQGQQSQSKPSGSSGQSQG